MFKPLSEGPATPGPTGPPALLASPRSGHSTIKDKMLMTYVCDPVTCEKVESLSDLYQQTLVLKQHL